MMNIKDTWLLVLLLEIFIACLPGVSAFQCYGCNSRESCNEPFDPSANHLIDCEGYCYKTTMKNTEGQMMFVMRGCQSSNISTCPDKCLKTGSEQCNFCCNEDKCNSAIYFLPTWPVMTSPIILTAYRLFQGPFL